MLTGGSTTGGRGGQPSAGCRVRCIHLILLLEFLLFSIGTASHSLKEIGDLSVIIDNSFQTTAEKLRGSLNFHPALQESEAHYTRKNSIFPEVSIGLHSKPGLLSLLRRFVAELCTSDVLDSRPVEKVIVAGSKQDSKFTSSSSSSNRRLGPPEYSKRRSPSGRFSWALDQQQHIHNEGRRMLEETVSSPPAQTQEVHLGPPAPADLLTNEKQDWNQDYAEPDVHPPSSN